MTMTFPRCDRLCELIACLEARVTYLTNESLGKPPLFFLVLFPRPFSSLVIDKDIQLLQAVNVDLTSMWEVKTSICLARPSRVLQASMSSLSSTTHACCVTKGPALSDEESEKWEGYSLVVKWIQIESKSFSRTVGIDIRLVLKTNSHTCQGKFGISSLFCSSDTLQYFMTMAMSMLGPPSRR